MIDVSIGVALFGSVALVLSVGSVMYIYYRHFVSYHFFNLLSSMHWGPSGSKNRTCNEKTKVENDNLKENVTIALAAKDQAGVNESKECKHDIKIKTQAQKKETKKEIVHEPKVKVNNDNTNNWNPCNNQVKMTPEKKQKNKKITKGKGENLPAALVEECIASCSKGKQKVEETERDDPWFIQNVIRLLRLLRKDELQEVAVLINQLLGYEVIEQKWELGWTEVNNHRKDIQIDHLRSKIKEMESQMESLRSKLLKCEETEKKRKPKPSNGEVHTIKSK